MLKTIGSPLVNLNLTIYYLFLNRWSTLNLKKNWMQTCKLHIMQFLNELINKKKF